MSAEVRAAADEARVLLVDDEPANLVLLERTLARAGYRELRRAVDGHEALGQCAAWHPHLVLLDLHMPGLDGFGVLERLREAGTGIPVLVLTADATEATKRRALAAGARDFLTKPFDLVETVLRVGNLVETRRLQLALEERNAGLERRVRERTADLEQARLEVLERLALAAEYRDDDTHEHAERVGRTAAAIAAALGADPATGDLLRRAAPLHDVGKIGVSDALLLKRGPLTAAERARMQTHTTIGGQILSGSRSPVLRLAEEIALAHHERWDGTGYPAGRVGADAPWAGRVVAVADVFDALVHERPYKPAWAVEAALDELRAQRGRQFDPEVVDVFLALDHAALLAPVRAGGRT